MISDLRFAVRQWAKNPGFAAVAILSLALGIAGNTTIFSFVNALLLRPPPVEHPGDLWQIWQWRPRSASGKRHGVWGPAAVTYLREHNQSFSALGAFSVEPEVRTWSRERGGESVQTVSVSGNFFDLCGIRPSLGRFFLPEEDRVPGDHPVVVVSHAFWRDRLAANPEVVGQSLAINGVALTVVGVAPEAFTGVLAGIAPDLWLPFMMVPSVARDPRWLTRTDSSSLIGFGRLKPGVSVARAEVDLTVWSQRFWSEVAGRNSEDGVVLSPSYMVPAPLRGYVQSFTSILWGAVVLVLLMACSNAANLQLARAAARRQEMVVRTALGAGRMRLIRQSLAESLLLAVTAGGLGLWMAMGLARGLAHLVPATLPIRLALPLDGRVLAFTLGVSLLTGILFGLAPGDSGGAS
jgi:predicted permease